MPGALLMTLNSHTTTRPRGHELQPSVIDTAPSRLGYVARNLYSVT